MTQIQVVKDPRSLMQELNTVFTKPPDDSGILQGVRKFRSGLPHVRVVHFPSPKNGGNFIPCEGRLEAKLALALEVDPEVLAYRTQPFLFPGPNGRNLVCDFAVKWKNHSYSILDVKPEGQLNRPSVMERAMYVRAFMERLEIPYRQITEKDLEFEPLLSIRMQLNKGSHVVLTKYEREVLMGILREGPMTLGALRQAASLAGCPVMSPEALVLSEDVLFPIGAPLRESTLLGANHGTHSSTSDGWGSIRNARLPL
ncbi:hypothetical protein [Uliginosibacterium sp. 31-12]|uniref:hypothetical protein n=1 Tax=Uliginosibacterium sp. 31-12 TaxID=3062781 RepID=UPI0026E2B25D|nr:hypothetical protein [Uliginosibacterium sp. 31-12]MDO6386424.1 hypothetical protein [Uliginosibacterium sp. 31-12]